MRVNCAYLLVKCQTFLLLVQVIEAFMGAKAKADKGKKDSALNDLIGCMHAVTTLRAILVNRLSSGKAVVVDGRSRIAYKLFYKTFNLLLATEKDEAVCCNSLSKGTVNKNMEMFQGSRLFALSKILRDCLAVLQIGQ